MMARAKALGYLMGQAVTDEHRRRRGSLVKARRNRDRLHGRLGVGWAAAYR